MISDEERREVAKRLRGLDATITNRDTLEQAVDKFMKAVRGDIPFSPIRYSVRNLCGLAGILADLIDRPAIKPEPSGRAYWRCPRCGAFNYRSAVTDCCGVIPAHYCANCGAEVNDGVD